MRLVENNATAKKIEAIAPAKEGIQVPVHQPELVSNDNYEVDVISQLRANLSHLELITHQLTFMNKEVSSILLK